MRVVYKVYGRSAHAVIYVGEDAKVMSKVCDAVLATDEFDAWKAGTMKMEFVEMPPVETTGVYDG